MELGILWFVLAGFILGFATSTLWEWLYFRRRRVRTYIQPAITSRQPGSNPYTLLDEGSQRPVTPAAEYRSPGVFLESEQPAPSIPLTHRQPAINTSSESVPAAYELQPTQPNAPSGRSTPAGEEPSI
jgi:hypothetical protein